MKRTFTANIDGQIFNIDEDAYQLLQTYLEQLHQTFGNAEGAEIVGDIESRIREIFAEKTRGGASVIVLDDVSRMIGTMGSPADLGEANPLSGSVPPPVEEVDIEVAGAPEPRKPQKRLYRNMQNKMFGGVFGGLATFLGWNANIMRLLYVVLTVCTYFWPLVVAYLLAWMIIPAAVTRRQRLQMMGRPVNVESVGQSVMEDSNMCGIGDPDGAVDGAGGWAEAFGIIGKIVMATVGIIGALIIIGCSVAVMVFGAAVVAYAVIGSGVMLATMGMNIYLASSVLMFVLFGLLLGISLVWLAATVVFRARGAGKALTVTAIVLMLLFLGGGIVLSILGQNPMF